MYLKLGRCRELSEKDICAWLITMKEAEHILNLCHGVRFILFKLRHLLLVMPPYVVCMVNRGAPPRCCWSDVFQLCVLEGVQHWYMFFLLLSLTIKSGCADSIRCKRLPSVRSIRADHLLEASVIYWPVLRSGFCCCCICCWAFVCMHVFSFFYFKGTHKLLSYSSWSVGSRKVRLVVQWYNCCAKGHGRYITVHWLGHMKRGQNFSSLSSIFTQLVSPVMKLKHWYHVLLKDIHHVKEKYVKTFRYTFTDSCNCLDIIFTFFFFFPVERNLGYINDNNFYGITKD